ncbi:hypothetical protein C8J57DRAFT_1538737 [Mycena rebaudengoi]|nr:hypothetical protein C8J57DRAFT_1538737 [Mycena rebaudengoi]
MKSPAAETSLYNCDYGPFPPHPDEPAVWHNSTTSENCPQNKDNISSYAAADTRGENGMDASYTLWVATANQLSVVIADKLSGISDGQSDPAPENKSMFGMTPLSRRARHDAAGFISYDAERGYFTDEWTTGPPWQDMRQCQAVGFCLETVEIAVCAIKNKFGDSVWETLYSALGRPAVFRLAPVRIIYSLYAYHPNGVTIHQLNHCPAKIPPGLIIPYAELVDHLRAAYAEETPIEPGPVVYNTHLSTRSIPSRCPTDHSLEMNSDTACVLTRLLWNMELHDIQTLRLYVMGAIDRICQGIDFLAMQGHIYAFLFPPSDSNDPLAHAPAETILFHLQLLRTNTECGLSYNNALLHPHEIDFLHAACRSLRGRQIYNLGFFIETLLNMQFDSTEFLQELLRQGHLNPMCPTFGLHAETLGDRLDELRCN